MCKNKAENLKSLHFLFQNSDARQRVYHPKLRQRHDDADSSIVGCNSSPIFCTVGEEPQASRFTWAIDNFSRLNVKKLYSDVFTIGGYKWRVLIFPKGNNVDYLSMYLDVEDSAALPYGWNRYAQFSLALTIRKGKGKSEDKGKGKRIE
ncbi:unnamed protein product [Fraxinus pennsylvanica]|uniref:MATH domain-containing protein n=1 Tax=Fraxinus pennsylvanica TaxID=56036 RepID=A0AAD1ZGQ3_9LAMI|nr:unnamed protein product [Fraxinus pennsylvanica]